MLNGNFIASQVDAPNFGVTNYAHWIKFSIQNLSSSGKLFLELPYPMIDSTTLYEVFPDSVSSQSVFEADIFNRRPIRHHNIVFGLFIKPGTTRQYFMRVKGNELVVVPLVLRDENGFLKASLTSELIAGIHIGLLFVMILYNLFIFFAIYEKSYLYYVLYILFIALTQTTITGYAFKFLWPGSPVFNNVAIVAFPALGGIFAILFFRDFLNTKHWVPFLDKVLHVIIGIYIFAFVARLAGYDKLSYRIIDFTGLAATLLGIGIAAKLSLKKYRPARFFLLAWTFFLIGIILFVLRNLNLLPYSNYTNYTMQAGTDIVVILLSFALADKINILKKEEAFARENALKVSQLNERIIREQNTYLENKVRERTSELSTINTELKDTLDKLKDAQTHLIESEKMASLGQLTAGIAHEINNPINFVSSNIKPLRRDISDILELLNAYDEIKQLNTIESINARFSYIDNLKQEMDIDYVKEELEMLLGGMEEGAKRTVEIVKGLKIFSRVDEADLNTVNINDGIEATLVILNNQLSSKMKLVKELGNIPDIECFPGKLNQVFMNIITNSIHATLDHRVPEKTPVIRVKTALFDDKTVVISIKDNGIGMRPEVKAKIFEPFFTTKDVGKGTGLGLSIVFKIIQAHHGTIEVISEPGAGTEFVIKLPVKRSQF